MQWENGFRGFLDGNGFFLRKGTGFSQKIPKKSVSIGKSAKSVFPLHPNWEPLFALK
jgi:hypothetical protein